MKTSLYIVLFVAFIDTMGIGLIYPFFSSMLFDTSYTLVPATTSHEMRGLWLGILLALMPLAQFFSAPVWGAISDSKGRRNPLLWSLGLGIFGYVAALGGVAFSSIALLLFSRAIIGFAAGNMSIVQATIVDVSLENEKTKNFGLYSMAQGVGFTLGPFLGGLLAAGGYNVPFLFALVIIGGNLGMAVFFFRETHFQISPKKIHWNMGFVQLKKAFRLTHIRTILFSSFLHNFAWSFFFEFIPVYLISRYLFTATDLGFFYAVAGGFYALSTGLLIRPFIARFKPEGLFFAGNVATAIVIFAMLLIPSSLWIWPLLILMCYVVAFVTPTSTTIVSNSASSKIQGEALGILGSVNSAALVLSPLFSGSIVGAYPELTMWVGSCMMIIAALIVFAAYGRRLFSRD